MDVILKGVKLHKRKQHKTEFSIRLRSSERKRQFCKRWMMPLVQVIHRYLEKRGEIRRQWSSGKDGRGERQERRENRFKESRGRSHQTTELLLIVRGRQVLTF